MLYLMQTLFVPWLLAALMLGLFVGWRSHRSAPHLNGLGWLGAGLGLFVVALFLAGLMALPGRAGLWLDTALHFLFWYIIGCCLGTVLSWVGQNDGEAEPVAAWVKPVRTESAATPPPPKPDIPAWILVSRQGPSAVEAPSPSAGSARAWADILLRGAPAISSAVPNWVKPLLPAATPAPASTPSPLAEDLPGLGLQWQAARDAGRVTLTGHVASENARSRMLADAGKTLAPLAVDDRLEIGAAPAGLDKMAKAALGHLAKLDRGIASIVDGRYTLTGLAPTAQNREALLLATKTLPKGFSLARADITSGPEGERPPGLDAPRAGKADDLKRIRGIGRQNEGRLHGLGIWHFEQVAAWTPDHARWVGSYLAFPGRIEREDWVGQAKLLAAGEETEFSKRVDKGLVATSKDAAGS